MHRVFGYLKQVHFLLLDDEAERDFLFGFEGLYVGISRKNRIPIHRRPSPTLHPPLHLNSAMLRRRAATIQHTLTLVRMVYDLAPIVQILTGITHRFLRETGLVHDSETSGAG